MATSLTHGFELSAEDELLLHSPPPRRALAWCERELGAGASVLGSEPLLGGTSSSVHLLQVERHGSRAGELAVLRRFVRSEWLEREPDLAVREAAALELLAGTKLPAPQLIASDSTGSEAGVPATLMSAVAGSVVWAPDDLDPYLRGLVGLIGEIHAVELPADSAFPPYAPYEREAFEPPPGTSRPEVWTRAFEIFDLGAPGGVTGLVHRDFHPGNVLWEGDAVSGIVDWIGAAVGPAEVDVGHCRMDLAWELGQPAAERFLEFWLEANGRGVYDRRWDLAAAIGGFPPDELAQTGANGEEFVAAAVERIG